MTDPTAANTTPPGWYPDPSGAPQQRWWDGMQWNEATQPNPAPAYSYGATTPYSYTTPAFAADTSINPNTPQVWAIAVAPLLVIVELAILFGLGLMTLDAIMESGSGTTPVDFADLVLRVVAYALVVILAAFDHRELTRRGVDRPFHWAFAFLNLVVGPVYAIGRSVIVKRRTGHGSAVMWVTIGMIVLSIIVVVVWMVATVAQIMQTVSTYGY